MDFDWSTFALQTLNFAILVWLLHRFLYKPMLRLIDTRRAEIEKGYADARTAEAQAKAKLTAIETERAGIARERAVALTQAAAQAEAQAATRRSQAERDAATLLDGVRKTLADERNQVLAEARRAALDLGAAIAGRLLAEVPMKYRAEAWIEHIEHHLGALPTVDRDALAQQLLDDVPLRVVTASAVSTETADVWRSRLQRALGHQIVVDYGVDPGIVAGAELHFPNGILRYSWRSTLDAMRAEIEGDGNAR